VEKEIHARFLFNTKILCSSPPLCSWPTKAPPGPLSHSPPSYPTNQSPSMSPTCPNRPYQHAPQSSLK
jgi:hypothetical protein